MVEELKDLIKGFPGAARWVQCFSHVINLIAKSVIRQFDLLKGLKKDIVEEGHVELEGFVDDLELNLGPAVEEGDDKGDENDDGWVDERDEMSVDQLEELEMDVKPMHQALLKVSPCALIVDCHEVLFNQSLSFANLPMPSRTPQQLHFHDGIVSLKN